MRSIQHINTFTELHGKKITLGAVQSFYELVKCDIDKKAITTKDPYFADVLKIKQTLRLITEQLPDGESAKMEISAARRKRYNEILEEQGLGLGILPLMIGAGIGKLIEHKIFDYFKKDKAELHGIDTLTQAEAKELGAIDEGLGYVSNPKNTYKAINKRILAEIEKGNLVYRKPWKNGQAHNYVTNRPYRGGNAFMIAIANYFGGTGYDRFLTNKQIRERGGKLKKNAEAFPVVAFIKSEETELNKQGEEVTHEKVASIFYNVYPIEHTIGVKLKKKDNPPKDIVPQAQQVVDNMPKRPKILHGGNRAFYLPKRDSVQMPHKKNFNGENEYYSTLFHELIHSTGNKKRIGRDMTGKMPDKKYALEELIAELGASYLCAVCEIDYFTLNNSAAYLKSWSKVLAKEIKDNPNFLMRAVFSATKAANYILSTTLTKEKNKARKSKKKGKSKEDKFTFPAEVVKEHDKLMKSGISREQAQNVMAYIGTVDQLKKIGRKRLYDQLIRVPLIAGNTALKVVSFIKDKEPKYGITRLKDPPKKKDIYSHVAPTSLKDYRAKIRHLEGYNTLLKESEQYDEKYNNEENKKQKDRIAKHIDHLNNAMKLQAREGAKLFKVSEQDYWELSNEFKNDPGRFKEKIGFKLKPESISKEKKGLGCVKNCRKKEKLGSVDRKEQVITYKEHKLQLTPWGGAKSDQFMFTVYEPGNAQYTYRTKGPAGTFEKAQQKAQELIDRMVKRSQPAAKQTAQPIVAKSTTATVSKSKEEILRDGGFLPSNGMPVKTAEIFRLPGEMGKFLQDIQRFKSAIAIHGDPHAGKTEFVFQLADAFASIGDDVGIFSLEQGGLESKDTVGARDRNISKENQSRVHITGEAEKGIESIKKFARLFKVVIIDSWQKLNLPATRFDDLRKEFPEVIWIVIFQQTTEGKAKGGTSSEFDAPIVMKVHLVSKLDRSQNWVELKKNRGNVLDVKYMISAKKTVPFTI